MNISFDIEAESLVQKVAAQGEMSTLVKAIIAEGYEAEFTSELDARDVLDGMDRDDIKDWAVNNLDRADLFSDDDVLDEMDHGDILDYVRNNVDDSRIVDLLDDLSASEILDHLVANGETDAIKDCAQQNELLPAGNTASNGDLLTEVLRRLTDGSMEADDVLDTLTKSGRLVIRTVYHTK